MSFRSSSCLTCRGRKIRDERARGKHGWTQNGHSSRLHRASETTWSSTTFSFYPSFSLGLSDTLQTQSTVSTVYLELTNPACLDASSQTVKTVPELRTRGLAPS